MIAFGIIQVIKFSMFGGLCELNFYKTGPIVTGLEHGKRAYRQVSNISGTLVGNKIVDHSNVVGTSPVGAAPTTSSFST